MLRRQIQGFMYILPKHIIFYSTGAIPDNQSKPSSLIEKLREEYSDIAPVKDTVNDDEVKNVHFSEWKSRIDLMKKYEFCELDIFKMISKYPSLLKTPFDKLEATVQCWYYADLGMKHFHLTLINQPILCDIDEEIIISRLPILRKYFRSSEALAILLMDSPNVMYDNWDIVQRKINYLLKVRKFKMGDIMQSCALSKSLDFIKLRLDLLEKCGIYKEEKLPAHKINKYDKSRYQNPLLKDILLPNTKDFTKVAKISVEEYTTFRDFFMLNSSKADDKDNDDGGGGDSNNNNNNNDDDDDEEEDLSLSYKH